MSDRLSRFALAYAANSWPVLPLHNPIGDHCSCGKDCGSPAKHPRTKNGLKDASIDPEQIHLWWTQWPNANIGVAIPDGIVVADFDTEGPNAVVPELRGDTAISKTGKGWHFWYTIIGQHVRPAVGVLPHLDIRAFGSYVVAPPSVHINGSVYTWLAYPSEVMAPAPEWLLELLGERVHALPVEPPVRVTTGTAAVRHLDALAQAVATAPEGTRNNVLFWAGCRAIEEGIPVEASERVLRKAAYRAGLTEVEVEVTLRSARRTVAA